MIRRDIVARFGLRLAVVYVLLVCPWPKVQEIYGTLFRSTGNAMLRVCRLANMVHLDPPRTVQPQWDVELVFRHPQKGNTWRIEFSSRAWGYLPTAASLALILAVPPPWPRRHRGVLVVLFLVLIFVGMRVLVGVLYGLNYGGVINAGPRGSRALEVALLSFSATPITTYVAAVIIWLIALYWTYDWDAAKSSEPQEPHA